MQVDDFVCTGSVDELGYAFDSLKKQYDLKRHVLEPDSTKVVKYLNLVLLGGGVEWECDPKHAATLVK